jgi:hypothetical protein
MRTQSSSSSVRFENEYLPSRYHLATSGASALVLERMPEPEFIDVAKRIQLVVVRQGQGRRRCHGVIITKPNCIDNQSEDWRVYRLNPDLAEGGVGAAVSSRNFQILLRVVTPAAPP